MAGMAHYSRGRAGPKSNWHDYHATELSGYPTVTKADAGRADVDLMVIKTSAIQIRAFCAKGP